MTRLVDTWYGGQPRAYLKPLSLLFGILSARRRWKYRRGKKIAYRASVPLIVVGNITAGGTGKTPLIIYLAENLKKAGYRPGIVSRGHGSKAPAYPYLVTATSKVTESGDEPLLIARNTDCPVVIAPKRPEAVKHLEQNFDCDVILSDDGLQHYPLARDIEIAVIDGRRGFGNGYLLPAGPLREKPKRLDEVDFIVCNGQNQLSLTQTVYPMQLRPKAFCHLANEKQFSLDLIAGELQRLRQQPDPGGEAKRLKVHAVTGIGNPERFFSSLCDCGFDIITHVFNDHHRYKAADIRFNDNLEVVMTEKDAVKCKAFAEDRDWYLKVEARVDGDFFEKLLQRLNTFSIQQNKEE